MFYRILSKLFDYPNEGLISVLPEIRARMQHGAEFDPAERSAVAGLLDHMAAQPLIELQADYVKTFDLVPEHALYLTHHVFGDDKNRGPALIDLTEYYKGFGLELASNELPDYLPLILEFADGLEPDEARLFLCQWGKVLKQLADNLAAAQSAYAPLVRLVEQRSRLVRAAA